MIDHDAPLRPNRPSFLQPSPAEGPRAQVPLETGFLRVPTPIGRIELRSASGAVTGITIEQDGRLPLDGHDEQPTSVLLDAAEQLDEYFRHERREFDVPLTTTGTPFQQSIWAALGDVAFGEHIGYGSLAVQAGSPGGGRAAGQAVRANALPILIPCHRVLGSGERVTGYSGGEGPATKRWLLDHEGIPYRR
ncbi:methylated-DNA--[protein]-cysteine S-methyltransferase [Plantibacter flavus]|uniref:methylated-DNA--[protein]-cysteine S-methyltransferase n=1 Tax=Plantibacter flavus TaxID=150123 RepID=UPI003F173142